MMNMSVKHILALSLFALSLNTQAENLLTKDFLIKQCLDLSENVSRLILNQGKKDCEEKLGLASSQIKAAGDLIIQDNYLFARQELASAIFTLQYTELSSCNHYIQISHAKLEARRIKLSLKG